MASLLLRIGLDFFKKIPKMGLLGPMGACLLIAYFGFHTVQGDRGILAWHKLIDAKEQALIKREKLQEHLATLELRVKLLRPTSLSLDMLGEQSRSVLFYGRKDEVVLKEGEDLFKDLKGALSDEPKKNNGQ